MCLDWANSKISLLRSLAAIQLGLDDAVDVVGRDFGGGLFEGIEYRQVRILLRRVRLIADDTDDSIAGNFGSRPAIQSTPWLSGCYQRLKGS